MTWSLVRTVDPALPVLTLGEAKDHLRVEHADDDSYIEPLVDAVAGYLEGLCNRAFITQTLELRFDAFPSCRGFYLPRYPLQSISSIVYRDTDGAPQTLSASLYVVDPHHKPGRVALASGESWPDTIDELNAVTVTLVAGNTANPEALPQDSKGLIKLLLAHWYEHREPTSGQPRHAIPLGLEALIWKHRVWGEPE